MTKKVNAILLSLLFILPTFGVEIEKHFCGDRLADVALFTGAGCACDEEDETDDCCREEEEVLQMDVDQFGSSIQRVPEITEHDIVLSSFIIQSTVDAFDGESELYLQDLPPPEVIPHYKMNCSFTFYG